MEYLKIMIVVIVFGSILYSVYEAINYDATHE